MKRYWKGYIKKNRTEGDCQLVTAVNAYHFLTGKKITNKRYERLIDLCGCRYGSAISIVKVHVDLGIKVLEDYHGPGLQQPCAGGEELPLEMSVWHKAHGFHSVLAVDFEPVTASYRITNFSRVTNLGGWIYSEDLSHYLTINPNKEKWLCRSFGLRGNK